MRWWVPIVLAVPLFQAIYIIYYLDSHAEQKSFEQNKFTNQHDTIATVDPPLRENITPEKTSLPQSKPVCGIAINGMTLKNDEYIASLTYNDKHIEARQGAQIGDHINVQSISSNGVVLHHSEFQQFIMYSPANTTEVIESPRQDYINTAFPYAEPIKGFQFKTISDSYKGDISIVSENVLSVHRSLFSKFLESKEEIRSIKFAVSSKGGFQATKVKQDSLFSNLGLETGDIIKSINNKELNSISDLVSVYSQLDNLNQIELNLERQGQLVYYYYELK